MSWTRLARWPLLAGAFLAGCQPAYNSVDPDLELLRLDGEGRQGVVAMLAPRAEAVIEVNPADRSFRSIPVGREPTTMSRPPGSDLLFTLERTDSTLSRIAVDGTTQSWDLGAPFTRLDWAPDGTRAIAWIDPASASTLEVEGSLNVNAYAVIRDAGGDLVVDAGSLTFQPRSVTFSADGSSAMIASNARLHVLDLEADPVAELAIPFSIDDSVHRTPDLVVPGPEGTQALATAQGVRDLFVISLDPVLIENVIGLDRAAQDIVWSRDGSKAIIADGSSSVTFMDLGSFDVETMELPHQVNRIVTSRIEGSDFALLYHDGGNVPFLTRVDLSADGTAPEDPESFLLEDGVVRVEVEPGESAAVIFHDGGTAGADFVPAQSLSLFFFDERAPSRILLDAAAWDLIFLAAGVVPGSEDPHVVVVLKDSGRLVRYNLRSYAQVVLDTYRLPHSIGRIPPAEGGSEMLFVVHDQDLGLVSFVDPTLDAVPSGGWPAVAGMATSGLLEGN